MTTLNREYAAFKKAVIISCTVHMILFLLILLSPHFPKPSRKGMIHYVNLISFPGGGGGGGGSPGGSPPEGGGGEKEQVVETSVPARETLRDLTTPQKLQQETAPSLRHPVEKPKKEKKPKTQKKAVIQKPQNTSKKTSQTSKTGTTKAGSGAGTGSGIRIGVGSGSGTGGGFGSEFSSQIGLSNFPFTYYLQILVDKISSNWYPSQVSAGISGDFHTTVFFKIFRSGQISVVDIEESSGIRTLDLSAVRAVQNSAPFPPLPDDYEDEYLGIHLIFEHNK